MASKDKNAIQPFIRGYAGHVFRGYQSCPVQYFLRLELLMSMMVSFKGENIKVQDWDWMKNIDRCTASQ